MDIEQDGLLTFITNMCRIKLTFSYFKKPSLLTKMIFTLLPVALRPFIEPNSPSTYTSTSPHLLQPLTNSSPRASILMLSYHQVHSVPFPLCLGDWSFTIFLRLLFLAILAMCLTFWNSMC